MAHSIYLALMLTVLIAFFPKDSHSVFQEPPYSVTEYTGIIAEFRCRNPWKDHVGWRINGVSLGSITNTTIVTHCNPSTRIQDGVYVLIIKAAVECNGTQVQCVAYNYDNYELTEYSSNATLTVLRPAAVTNLDYEASMENNTFSIAISWNPIPSTIDRMPLFPRISNITYNVTVIDNFNNIVYSSESVNDTRVVFTLGNPSPCYYYNVSVISIINAKYSGTEVIRGKIYLYQDFPPNVSDHDIVWGHKSAVTESHQIQYVFFFSVSLYICSADLSLSYQGRSYFINPVNTSGEIPGMINEITYLVNQSLFDAKYNNVKINIGNALQEVLVAINITLNTYDVQNVSSHNGNLTIVFLNGSAAQGAFIVLAIAENKLPNSSFEYVYASAEKPPADNTLIVAISRLSRTNIAKSNSSLILSVYDIESTGLLKSSRSLIPVTTLIIQNTSTLTSSDSNYGNDNDPESGWKLDTSSTSHSIHFICEIFRPETIRGCSAIVHQDNPQELVLMVNSSNNSGYGTKVHLEVEIQNNSKGNLYHYAVFPITSKGIIDSRAMKGSVLVNETLNNDIDDQEPKPSSIPLISAIIITILTIIIAAISIIIIILVIYKRRTKKKIGAFDHINNGHDPNHNGVEMNQFQVVQNAGQRAINVVDIEDHDDDQVKCK